jgi:hypothetical protein
MPGQARLALRDGDQRPVVPLAARARVRSAGARVGRARSASVHFYNNKSKVERFVRAVGARLSRYDPEVDPATTVLDREINRFLSAASPTTSRADAIKTE